MVITQHGIYIFRLFYFTIVVVSTCGYGDIRPVNNLETLYNIMNALVGSITLGVFVECHLL